MSSDYASLFQDLEIQGWTVADHLLPLPLTMQLYLASRYAWRQGYFQEARIGSTAQPTRIPSIRGDTIHWLDHRDTIAQRYTKFQRWADDLQQQLNQHFFMGLRRSEFHFARYEKGLGYAQHIDQHAGQPHRKISVVLYLNRNWAKADGGELCLYAPTDKAKEMHRIVPQFGRVAMFRSDLIPHAVLPCHRPRWSLTGWFRNDSQLLDTIVAPPASNDDPFPGASPSGKAA